MEQVILTDPDPVLGDRTSERDSMLYLMSGCGARALLAQDEMSTCAGIGPCPVMDPPPEDPCECVPDFTTRSETVGALAETIIAAGMAEFCSVALVDGMECKGPVLGPAPGEEPEPPPYGGGDPVESNE